MPNRMIRDGLLESEAVLQQTLPGRWLFVTILLSADDVGLFEATEFKLARRADVPRQQVAKLLQGLADADLVRLYEIGGRRFGFVPRFRQRVQIKNTKHPLPPPEIFAGDSDAALKIKHLAPETTVGQPLDNSCQTDAHLMDTGSITDGQPPEAEEEAEDKVSDVHTSPRSEHPHRRRKAGDMPACPTAAILKTYNELLPMLPAATVCKPNGAREKAIRSFWTWVVTSTKRTGERRATTREEGLTWIRTYFERVLDNDHLMGRTERAPGFKDWKPDLDYLLSEKGMKAVIERTQVAA